MTTINGTTKNDTLHSTNSGDTLIGGLGDDLYIVNHSNVHIVEQVDIEGALTRVSTDSLGAEANGNSFAPVLSDDGRKVAFMSNASNLVAGDGGGYSDVFVKDLTTGEVTLVSTAGTTQGNGPSGLPLFTADGNQIVFSSDASNLVAGDSNGERDIFIKDLTTGVITRVNTTTSGAQAVSPLGGTPTGSDSPTVSADGHKVAFNSFASNLVIGDSNAVGDVFVKDLTSGVLTLISSTTSGVIGNAVSDHVRLSADGNIAVFESNASNFATDDFNAGSDIYVKNLTTGVLTLVSRSADGVAGNGSSYYPEISADGSKVVFGSYASNLVAGDSNNTFDIFVKDLTTGAVTRISPYPVSAAQYEIYQPVISADGSKVAFVTNQALVARDSNGTNDVYVYDLTTGKYTLASVTATGGQAHGPLYAPHFSGDGNTLVFETADPGLVSGDTNNALDIFTKDIGPRAGTDTVQATVSYTLDANVDNLTLLGGANLNGTGNTLANLLVGNSGKNILSGAAGDDTLDGGTGNDTLVGGTGNDLYVVSTSDVIVEKAGEGSDSVLADSSYTLSANVEKLYLQGNLNINATGNELANTLVGNAANNRLDGAGGNDTLVGGLGNDTYLAGTSDTIVELYGQGIDTVIADSSVTLADNVENLTLTLSANLSGTGNASNNLLIGNSGNNILNGAAGDDTLDGGLGRDTLNGGLDNDTYIVNATTVIHEDVNAGWADTVRSADSYTLSANLENLILTGSANINGTGNAGDNRIQGNSGNNILTGGGGFDTLIGGLGNDTYVLSPDQFAGWNSIVEAAGGGSDTVIASYTYTLSGNIEQLTLTGTTDLAGWGNELNNVITGNSGNNQLYGQDGNDTLIGGAGNDTLDGGTGTNRLIGGVGNDHYTVFSTDDVIVEAASGGGDTVDSYTSYKLSANVETLNLVGSGSINGYGNDQNNHINGNNFNNVLNGGGGKDTLAGSYGNDTYIVTAGDVIIENNFAGTDTVWADFSYSLGANLENLVLTGTADIDATGTTLSNRMTGNSGNNTFITRGGYDTLIGGQGDDLYILTATSGRVIEDANGGNDTVQIERSSYKLTDNVENLVLTGTFNNNGSGNDLDNHITGNSGYNTLSGGLGNDTLAGGLGNDIYYIDSGDTVIEDADGGVDTVHADFSYTLGANLEKAYLSGTENLNLSGNDLANYLIGNDGQNILDGGLANDTLAGGLGNDTYLVSTSDTILEYTNQGLDTAIASSSYTLSANVENLELAGTASIKGTGNALANSITGNSGNNSLDGAAGNDTLIGGLGNDTLTGGEGYDLFLFDTAPNSTTNHDTITDLTSGDKLQLSHVIFSALGDVGGLTTSFFRSGAGLTSGQDSDDHIIYNTTDGKLYYDADGSGSGASVLFAQLGTTTIPHLASVQIQVV